MAYSAKYVTVTEVPVQIPDDYSTERKLEALELAESEIEFDLKNGDELTEGEASISLVQAAIKQKATCELAKGADDPNSSKMGDLSDDGTTKSDYAQTFCDKYDELVSKLLSTERFQESTEQYVYSTSGDNGSGHCRGY